MAEYTSVFDLPDDETVGGTYGEDGGESKVVMRLVFAMGLAFGREGHLGDGQGMPDATDPDLISVDILQVGIETQDEKHHEFTFRFNEVCYLYEACSEFIARQHESGNCGCGDHD